MGFIILDIYDDDCSLEECYRGSTLIYIILIVHKVVEYVEQGSIHGILFLVMLEVAVVFLIKWRERNMTVPELFYIA